MREDKIAGIPVECMNEDGEQVRAYLNKLGQEMGDPVPTAPPVGYTPGPSLSDMVRRMIHNEISTAAELNEFETFEEADDFDVEDDPPDPRTPYEAVFDPPPPPPAPAEGGGGAQPPGDQPVAAEPPPAPPAPSAGSTST